MIRSSANRASVGYSVRENNAATNGKVVSANGWMPGTDRIASYPDHTIECQLNTNPVVWTHVDFQMNIPARPIRKHGFVSERARRTLCMQHGLSQPTNKPTKKSPQAISITCMKEHPHDSHARRRGTAYPTRKQNNQCETRCTPDTPKTGKYLRYDTKAVDIM